LKKTAAYNRGHTPSQVKAERREGTGDGFRLSGCETFSGNTFAGLGLCAVVKQSAPIKRHSTVREAKARLLPLALTWVNGSVPVPHLASVVTACVAE
jgi:hypothetical protein